MTGLVAAIGRDLKSTQKWISSVNGKRPQLQFSPKPFYRLGDEITGTATIIVQSQIQLRNPAKLVLQGFSNSNVLTNSDHSK